MKWIALFLAIMASGTGGVAAWRWLQSSKVEIDPGWRQPGEGGPIEPLDESGKALGWSVATLQAFAKAADLNRRAAIWTAMSVALAALSAVAGNWPF